ncbi:MAG: glucosamine-6-phosphate deaminase [Nanoarchaeota archaeon]|nr:glucosamine-6-phosphate deaminase [Nanoarchaeota archaeon]
MRILIFQTKEKAMDFVVEFLIKEITRKPEIVLGLASGHTFIPIYRILKSKVRRNKINLGKIKTFNLDEYLKVGYKESFRYFMDKKFFIPLKMKKEQIHFLQSNPKNVKAHCNNYEKEILEAGRIDIQLLGIGRDGHIGFNEPGSIIKSRTRRIKLNEITVKDNNAPSRWALTMGIDTILKAKKIVLIATGRRKAGIMKRFFDNKISPELPATLLKKRKDLIVVLDKDAASKLRIRKTFK